MLKNVRRSADNTPNMLQFLFKINLLRAQLAGACHITEALSNDHISRIGLNFADAQHLNARDVAIRQFEYMQTIGRGID